ncbi:GmrSD restriction endonuclease domain-containing protein [Pseudomonas sp. H1_F01]
MHLTPSDPDIATLYRKIRADRLDLQPNFQRGEVWGKGKKQRLVDSVLRGWHIPPIHVIQVPNSERQEVLDGQQRLAAIRDFMQDGFPINGEQEPAEKFIAELDGLFWSDLSQEIRGKFEDFTIRVLTISDYKPREPGELFYRLNQPTNLTSAEQRNAYFGEARQQIKNLTEHMEEGGFSRELMGFSNSRMAYDDILAKFLLTLESRTLTKKITANTVTSRYRESTGFSAEITSRAVECLRLLFECLENRNSASKLNKATISSWLIFIYKALNEGINLDTVISFYDQFETLRENHEGVIGKELIPNGITQTFLVKTIQIYQDRASSRVADTSSVILRDIILWGLYSLFHQTTIQPNNDLSPLNLHFHYLSSQKDISFSEASLSKIAKDLRWGDVL